MEDKLELLPFEEQIQNELVKQNVTEAVIRALREKYAHLKIAGIEDKETYLLVKDGRKECKAVRVLVKKVCEKGREKAVAEQKAWVAKQKVVTDLISEIEDPLEEQEKAYEAAVAKDKEERKRRQEEQLIMRQQVLTGMGAMYSDGSFVLGEVSFEMSLVKECESDIWEETILPKFQEEYQKVEAERIEKERLKQEQEAEFKRQQEALDQQRKELEEQANALKKAKEDQERRDREEKERKEAEEKMLWELMVNSRCVELVALGMIDRTNRYTFGDIVVSGEFIEGADDQSWAEMIEELKPKVEQKKQEAEQERLAEIEAQKETQRINDLRKYRTETLKQYSVTSDEDPATYTDEQWEECLSIAKEIYEKSQKEKWEKEEEEKRRQEELIRLQRLDQAKDKEKWEEMMQKIKEITVYEMRSSQYRKKAMILREKLEEIKAL